jgi:hypothetical protein
MKAVLFAVVAAVAFSEAKAENTNNPLHSVKETQVHSVLISQPVCIAELTDEPVMDPFRTSDKPERGYFVATVGGLAPRLRITASDLVRKLFTLGSSVAPDPEKTVPGAGFWAHIAFEDASGRRLAEFWLSPAASLVQCGSPDRGMACVGQSQSLSRIVYDLLKEHAPDAVSKWKEQGLEQELFKDLKKVPSH